MPTKRKKVLTSKKLRDAMHRAFDSFSPDEVDQDMKPTLVTKAMYKQLNHIIASKATQKPEVFADGRMGLLAALRPWACVGANQLVSRVTTLFGDFGFGKTIVCQLLAKQLANDYWQDLGKLLPIYLDSKALQAEFTKDLTQLIEHLSEVMLTKTGNQHAIIGAQLIAMVQKHHCVVIFDGFDEIAQCLDFLEQQVFYHTLLDTTSPQIYIDDAVRLRAQAQKNKDENKVTNTPDGAVDTPKFFASHLLIHCHAHFFNSIKTESGFLVGNERHNLVRDDIGDKNIQRYYMAPFRVLGNTESKKVYQMLGDIYDLTELSAHPLVLGLICCKCIKLQGLAERRQAINSANLYLQLFDIVGDRDAGKHQICLSDKQQFLGVLALNWRRARRNDMKVKQLDNWFANYANSHLVIKHQLVFLGVHSMELLMQELRNASLLARDDEDSYHFAHINYLEFFRALGIFEAIRFGHVDAFGALPGDGHATFDQETAQFVVNWWQVYEAKEWQAFDAEFVKLLQAGESVVGKQFSFDLWWFGQLSGVAVSHGASDFLHSQVTDWSGLFFIEPFIPESLSHLSLIQVNCADCYFHLVVFCGFIVQVNFAAARIRQCYAHNHQLPADLYTADLYTQADVTDTAFFPAVLSARDALTTCRRVCVLLGHSDAAISIQFNNDNSQPISGSDNSIKLWNARTGEYLQIYVDLGRDSFAFTGKPRNAQLLHATDCTWQHLDVLSDAGNADPITQLHNWQSAYYAARSL